MKNRLNTFLILAFLFSMISCVKKEQKEEDVLKSKKELTAADILGNPKYLAISYGGYREKSREDGQP